MPYRLVYLCCGAMTLASCSLDNRSDYERAKAEVPVDLQAGLYELRLGGATLIELVSGERTGQLCLNSYDASQLPKDALSKVAEPWEGCATLPNVPQGNAMSGSRKCEERKVPMTATFTGTHTRDRFEINGLVAQGAGESASIMRLGSGEFSIVGKRIGECNL